MQTIHIISRLLPVVLLIILGFLLKKTGTITPAGTDIIKKLIVNVGLPSVFSQPLTVKML